MPSTVPALPDPRFQLGDRVRVIRKGTNAGLTGVVVEVNTKGLINRYQVEFNGLFRAPFAEPELGLVVTA